MSDAIKKVYVYDGSFDGFLCCVYESFMCKEIPVDIVAQDYNQCFMFPVREIMTNKQHADRVFASFGQKISQEVGEFIQLAFLTECSGKETCLLRFIRKAYKVGASILNWLGDNDVHVLTQAVKHLKNEAHLLTGFVRFSDYDGILIATIGPKNRVLSCIATHFTQRYNSERFLIYDTTHQEMLIYQPDEWKILQSVHFETPEVGKEEKAFRQLWKTFHQTIGIQARRNPACQQTHMPKRYWSYMTEMDDQTNASLDAADKLLGNE